MHGDERGMAIVNRGDWFFEGVTSSLNFYTRKFSLFLF